jgi:hypothetical protein
MDLSKGALNALRSGTLSMTERPVLEFISKERTGNRLSIKLTDGVNRMDFYLTDDFAISLPHNIAAGSIVRLTRWLKRYSMTVIDHFDVLSSPPANDDFVPIAALTPYIKGFRIQARVIHKGEPKQFQNDRSSGQLMTLHLVDVNKDAIVATLFNEAVDKYLVSIEVGKVYSLARGTVRPANRKFNPFKTEYSISFDTNSDITLLPEHPGIPSEKYVFVRLADLSSDMANRIIDILVLVHQESQVNTFRTKAGDSVARKTLIVYDRSEF